MLHPSYTDLMNAVNSGVENGDEPTVNSRYSIVIAASKRARQLIDQKDKNGNKLCYKPLSVAVDEIYNGEVKILGEDEIPEDEIDFNEEAMVDLDEEIVLSEDEEAAAGEVEITETTEEVME